LEGVVTFMTDWEPAPTGQVLLPGACLARDDDGQGCARGVLHPLSPHQATGLRAWLDAGTARALMRAYEESRADELEAMETPLFARYEFTPIARQDLVRTETAGLNATWSILVSPGFAPSEEVTIRLRIVCFARPW
jgi:hypothetical protein